MKKIIPIISGLLACQFAFAQETLQTVTARGDVSNGDITVNGRLKIASTNISMIGVGGVDYLDFRGVNDSPILRFNRNSLDAYFMNGKVGIGTTMPLSTLHIASPSGINTTTFRLDANAAPSYGSYSIVRVDNANGTGYIHFIEGYGAGHTYWGANGKTNMELRSGSDGILNLFNTSSASKIQFNTNGDSYFNGGNVGIGTTSPAERLSVNGKIRAKEIKVETANWPDYVFSTNHRLRSLGDLEKYIQTNGHLPEIPSAEEASKDGIELGEMNAKLLKKIEELTLYLIEKDKEVSLLEQRVRNLENKK